MRAETDGMKMYCEICSDAKATRRAWYGDNNSRFGGGMIPMDVCDGCTPPCNHHADPHASYVCETSVTVLRLSEAEAAGTDGMVIHAHETLPPVLTTEPASYAGTVGMYWDATPDGAAEALEYHRRHWSDWQPDEEVVQLAKK